MGRISEAGSFIKNSADRLRALLTITQVLTCSTEDANNSSRSSNTGVSGDGPIGEGSGRPGGGLCDSNIQPPIEDHVVVPVDSIAASGFSFGTTAKRTTSPGHVSTSIDDMGNGGRHNQDRKMEEFRNFVYWITTLFIAILVGLLSANKRKPEPLFRSCRSLVIGGTICCIAMLMLTLIRPSSQRALNCLEMLQYLTVGLLFVSAVLVFTLL